MDEFSELNTKSKKLGNWRTGLVAGSAVTNVAGAIIAGKNQKDNSELETMVKNCLSAVDVLSKCESNFGSISVEEVNKGLGGGYWALIARDIISYLEKIK